MEWLSLSGDLTRDSAVEQLLAPSTSADADSELGLHADAVRRIDAVAAAAVRLRMARHHREHEQGTVTLMLPDESSAAVRLAALLDPLPERVDTRGAGQRSSHRRTMPLVPATPARILMPPSRSAAGRLRRANGRDSTQAHGLRHGGHDGACRQRRGPRRGAHGCAGRGGDNRHPWPRRRDRRR